MINFTKLLIVMSVVIVCHATGMTATGKQLDSLQTDLAEIIAKGQAIAPDALEKVRKTIEENPEEARAAILAKTAPPDLPDTDLAVYLWALGLTQSPQAIDDIIRLSAGKESSLVLNNCYAALAGIGGPRAGEYLLTRLNQTQDPEKRYGLLDLLAQMQYQPAIPKTLEILELAPDQFYWKNIFVFGKYGDAAVPFLLSKIGDPNENIRMNSIMVLGQWIIPAEATTPLKEQFQLEQNPNMRGLILSSLTNVNPDLQDIQAFSKQVIAKEKESNVRRFAQATIDNHDAIAKSIASFRAEKKADPIQFGLIYYAIFANSGKGGDYEALAQVSTRDDEMQLKALKEQILRRNSDECFDDYQKVNKIIIFNRLAGQ